jgi:type I restriction enzyme, S subunit
VGGESIEDLIKEDILLAPKDGNHGNIHPKSSDYVSHGIPFIMASDIKNGKINLLKCSKISKEQASPNNKKSPPAFLH